MKVADCKNAAKLIKESQSQVQGPYFCLVVGNLLVVVFFRVVVAVVALQMHWGMLCEVLRDHTGSYVLSQKSITKILTCMVQV